MVGIIPPSAAATCVYADGIRHRRHGSFAAQRIVFNTYILAHTLAANTGHTVIIHPNPYTFKSKRDTWQYTAFRSRISTNACAVAVAVA